MGYFDQEKNVEQYIAMAAGSDGRELVAALTALLPAGASVLELGMGPGKDLALLAEHYQVTGSDASQIFVDRYLAQHVDADVLPLDAVTLETERRFDCIFSNKVLHHLTRNQLRRSIGRQAAVLTGARLVFHSFWYGNEEQTFAGLRFIQQTEPTLRALFADSWEVLTVQRYAELDAGDSLWVAARARPPAPGH